MSEHIDLLRRLDEPATRRAWLLYRALECLPLDHAIHLARAAEAFIAGSPVETEGAGATADPEAPVVLPPPGGEQPHDDVSGNPTENRTPPNRTRLALSPAQREELLEGLAGGAKNAELASRFGLSVQQVQGIRIGSARDIAKRREQRNKNQAPSGQTPRISASVDEVVRYLRQQDDVVVRQATGDFLVNGRFELTLVDLVARANRMRGRQGKPSFEMAVGQTAGAKSMSSAADNGRLG